MRSGEWLRLAGAILCLGLIAGGAAARPTVPTADTVPPSIEYGALYRAVELGQVFADSKTFPDMIPDAAPGQVLATYQAQRVEPGFNLADFVHAHFTGPTPPGPTVLPAPPGTPIQDYVRGLWPVLQQMAMTVPPWSTLQPLPRPYIVPGGRFREVYYWDTYFSMLGLEEDGQAALARDMLADIGFEIDRYGHVPNGNRSYYLSRSQPPFFTPMVELVAQHDGAQVLKTYLPEMLREWQYWMNGAASVAPGHAIRNVVRLADGTLLNRYYDDRAAPRDESYREDVLTAAHASRPAPALYRDLRAAAESGWDFSSRWLADGKTLATVRTLAIAPVDLNCLMAHMEQAIARADTLRGDRVHAKEFATRADVRIAAIRRLFWDPSIGAFTDLLWQSDKQTGVLSAATVYPLLFGDATPAQAETIAATVRDRLLLPGGLATTLDDSGQQWDLPNGWAPLQWIAIAGLERYGYADLAATIARRWVHKVFEGYAESGKLVEKYNVTKATGDFIGGGGEYATQIGFGWTNGVLESLLAEYPDLARDAPVAPAHPVGTGGQ